jgi:hypothetical protein
MTLRPFFIKENIIYKIKKKKIHFLLSYSNKTMAGNGFSFVSPKKRSTHYKLLCEELFTCMVGYIQLNTFFHIQRNKTVTHFFFPMFAEALILANSTIKRFFFYFTLNKDKILSNFGFGSLSSPSNISFVHTDGVPKIA